MVVVFVFVKHAHCATENTYIPARLTALSQALSRTHSQSSPRIFPNFSNVSAGVQNSEGVPRTRHLVRDLVEMLLLAVCSVEIDLVHATGNLFHFEKIDQLRMLSRLSLDLAAIFTVGKHAVLHVSKVVSIFDCRQDLLDSIPPHQHCSLNARCSRHSPAQSRFLLKSFAVSLVALACSWQCSFRFFFFSKNTVPDLRCSPCGPRSRAVSCLLFTTDFFGCSLLQSHFVVVCDSVLRASSTSLTSRQSATS